MDPSSDCSDAVESTYSSTSSDNTNIQDNDIISEYDFVINDSESDTETSSITEIISEFDISNFNINFLNNNDLSEHEDSDNIFNLNNDICKFIDKNNIQIIFSELLFGCEDAINPSPSPSDEIFNPVPLYKGDCRPLGKLQEIFQGDIKETPRFSTNLTDINIYRTILVYGNNSQILYETPPISLVPLGLNDFHNNKFKYISLYDSDYLLLNMDSSLDYYNDIVCSFHHIDNFCIEQKENIFNYISYRENWKYNPDNLCKFNYINIISDNITYIPIYLLYNNSGNICTQISLFKNNENTNFTLHSIFDLDIYLNPNYSLKFILRFELICNPHTLIYGILLRIYSIIITECTL